MMKIILKTYKTESLSNSKDEEILFKWSFAIITCYSLKNIYCSYPLIPLIYFPFTRWKFVKFTLTFPACILTIHNTTTSVAHFSYIFLIKTKFRFACVCWLLGNIKQPPLTPKLSTANAGVDLTLPTMTSHGAYRDQWRVIAKVWQMHAHSEHVTPLSRASKLPSSFSV